MHSYRNPWLAGLSVKLAERDVSLSHTSFDRCSGCMKLFEHQDASAQDSDSTCSVAAEVQAMLMKT